MFLVSLAAILWRKWNPDWILFCGRGCFYFCLHSFAQGALTLSVAILFFFQHLKVAKTSFFHVKSLALPLLFVRKRTAIICFCLVDKHLDQTNKNRLFHLFPITHNKMSVFCIGIWVILWNLDLRLEGGFDSFFSLFYSILIF